MSDRDLIKYLNKQLDVDLIANIEEGGYLYSTYRSNQKLPNELFPNLATPESERPLGDAIYYLVTRSSPSRMHRTMGDIIYHFYTGDPFEMLLIYPEGHKPQTETILLGNDIQSGEMPQKSVPGGTWIGGRVRAGGEYAVMGVTLSPGFVPIDYQIADPNDLKSKHKKSARFIDSLNPAQSFYIFDIDENMLSLPTKVTLFPKNDEDNPIEISQEDHDREKNNIGISGEYEDYKIIGADSYRYFNDITKEEKRNGLREHFVTDIEKAFRKGTFKGPSWNVFTYAVDNNRPTAIITARGHSADVIRAGMRRLVSLGAISKMPNLIEVQCVNNPIMKNALESLATKEENPTGEINSASRKRIAARAFVEKCVKKYGEIPEHKFGMSDDNKNNVYSVIQAMADTKEMFNHMRFYIINTHQNNFVKMEIEPLIPRRE